MKIIALTAPANRSGKTTYARALKDELTSLGLEVRILSFATELKKQCAEALSDIPEVRSLILDIDQSDAKDTDFDSFKINNVRDIDYQSFLRKTNGFYDKPRSWRWHMIAFGTGYMRHHLKNDLIWTRHLIYKINDSEADGVDIVIIDDLRFVKEAQALKLFNVDFYEVNRSELDIECSENHRELLKELGSDVLRLYFNDLQHVKESAKAWAIKYKANGDLVI